MPAFIPGIELSRQFYLEIVRPLLNGNFPRLFYAAALLGPGSETLGFDTEMSVDHDWGARLFIFLKEEDAGQKEAIIDLMSQRLPVTFQGFPVHLPNGPFEPRTQTWKLAASSPVNHQVIPLTVRDFVRIQLGYDLAQLLQAADWLTFPAHSLGELVAGEVYYDATGEITQVRERFVWYPHDIWLYLLAASWQRIGQEEHLMPRAGSAGDELGAALIGSRLVKDAMRLCFLMEKQYAPYPKWFGTAFKRLKAAHELEPVLWQAQLAPTWQERERALSKIYEALARRHNNLKLTKPLPEAVSPFYDRPFQVIHGEQFAQALVEQITDPEVKRIAGLRLIGSIDQWSDNTDMEGLDRLKFRQLYSA